MTNLTKELEEKTALLWLNTGAINISEFGSENTYYLDQFDIPFFCKNYPNGNPGIEVLNNIQKQWINLESNASEKEKLRVFNLMEKLPKNYITGRNNLHNLMVYSSPKYPNSKPLSEIKRVAVDINNSLKTDYIRDDICWNCAGSWINI